MLHLKSQDEKELIKGVEVETNSQQDLYLKKLIEKLKELGFALDKNIFSYYSKKDDLFIFADGDPLKDDTVIPRDEYLPERCLTLKCRPKSASTPPSAQEQKSSLTSNSTSQGTANTASQSHAPGERSKSGRTVRKTNPSTTEGTGSRRTKERKIGFIIEKVSMWRKLYNGITNSDGNTVRYSLEDAAQKVSISKKSLDDYLLQLRFGRKFGFNFNEHKDDKVGVLRAYVKKHKNQNKLIEQAQSPDGKVFQSIFSHFFK